MAKKQEAKSSANVGNAQQPFEKSRRTFLRRAIVVAGAVIAVGALSSFACRCEDDTVEWSDENKDQQNPFDQGGSGQLPESNPEDNRKKSDSPPDPPAKKGKSSENPAKQ